MIYCKAMGLTGVEKSQVLRICKALYDVMQDFRNWPLEGQYPYLWKVRLTFVSFFDVYHPLRKHVNGI
jgi:hypothetical protein